MRSGWRVLLAFAALCGVGFVVMPARDSWLFSVKLAALFAGGAGASITAAVMLRRGAGATHGWPIERPVLDTVVAIGLIPVALVLLTAVLPETSR